ncbi:MAG: hypothetical protein Q9226_008426 [Calogaya cf. arnoldii]
MATAIDPEAVWDLPVDVPDKWIENVDKKNSGNYWTRTAEIQTVQADGTPKSFFVKVIQNKVGKAMVSGEYESMKALHSTSPDLTPEPIAWGSFAQADHVYFFLCEFIDMTDDLPDVETSMKMLADLHKKSSSPNGQYGFHVPTLQGTIPQYTEWTASWVDFFTKSIKLVFENEERSQGIDEEVRYLEGEILSKVVPRLLRPLETGGRHITPRLIHGNIWDGNTSMNVSTDLPVFYDATCIHAHNEMDLAPIRPVRHRMGKEYVKAYFRDFPISPPEEDQDDRNALYCLRWDMNCSTLYRGNLRYRKICIEVMKNLTQKYPEGYEGWAKARGEEVAFR